MTWRIVEQVPSVPGTGRYFHNPSDGYFKRAEQTTALEVWRCDGCGARACGPAGQNPGQCLKRGCRFAVPEGRPARR